jgi:hypothetical protein
MPLLLTTHLFLHVIRMIRGFHFTAMLVREQHSACIGRPGAYNEVVLVRKNSSDD